MGVSMPLRWEELDDIAGADALNIRSAIDHVDKWKVSPWASYWKTAQPLRAAMKRLGVARKVT
jgi:bifunctional non-homologous end joining protein LigD